MDISKINPDMSIEEMVMNYPGSITFFLKWGIRCFS